MPEGAESERRLCGAACPSARRIEGSLTHCLRFFIDLLVPQDSLMTSKKKGNVMFKTNCNNKTKSCLHNPLQVRVAPKVQGEKEAAEGILGEEEV